MRASNSSAGHGVKWEQESKGLAWRLELGTIQGLAVLNLQPTRVIRDRASVHKHVRKASQWKLSSWTCEQARFVQVYLVSSPARASSHTGGFEGAGSD